MNDTNQAPKSESPPIKPPRFAPPTGTWITIGVCIAAIGLLQYLGPKYSNSLLFDRAVFNLMSYGFGLIALITPWVWMVFFSDHSVAFRRVVMLVPPLLLGSLRVEGFTGHMVPTGWRFAWQRPRDFAFVKPQVVKPAEEPEKTESPDSSPSPKIEFNQFLGPDRSAYVPDFTWKGDWSTSPPRELWRQKVGVGWAAFSVSGDRIITLEQYGDDETTTCRSLKTGELIWSHSDQTRHEDPLVMGGIGPRSTATIFEGKVFVLGATGRVNCLRLSTGERTWSDDLLKRYDLTQAEDQKMIAWGRANSPLVYEDLVIVPAGGKPEKVRSLVAYERESGNVRWEAGDSQVSYVSPAVGTLCGKKQIVSVNEKTVTGHDPANGDVLWSHPWPSNSNGDANCSQPHFVGENQILLCKGYGIGAELITISEQDGKFSAKQVWKNRKVLKTKFTNAVVVGDYAYALSDGILECISWADGKSRWKNGRYGHGQILVLGDRILVQTEQTGELVQVALDPEKFSEIARIKVLSDSVQAWNNPCLSGTKLLIRNAEEAVCLELGE